MKGKPRSTRHQSKDQKTFSVKDQRVNILDFVGHIVSVAYSSVCFLIFLNNLLKILKSFTVQELNKTRMNLRYSKP